MKKLILKLWRRVRPRRVKEVDWKARYERVKFWETQFFQAYARGNVALLFQDFQTAQAERRQMEFCQRRMEWEAQGKWEKTV
jgi:hypothetical protein